VEELQPPAVMLIFHVHGVRRSRSPEDVTVDAESFMHPITSAFLRAAADLGFSFEPSFLLRLPEGEVLETLGLVRDFGSERGTLLFARDTAPNPVIRAQLSAEGYSWSELFSSYETYDRDLFAATLDDWCWFGAESSAPSWYTGKQWGQSAGGRWRQ
jgi:hypothetical protein